MALVPPSQLAFPLAVSCAGTVVVWIVAAFFLRNIDRGALVASVAVTAFFLFGHVRDAFNLTSESLFWPWLLGLLGVVALAGWKRKEYSQLTRASNAVGILLVAFPLLTSLYSTLTMSSNPVVQGPNAKPTTVSRPDIFYIILDGYGRSDALQRTFGYSNAGFIEGLEKRGFSIADSATTNYVQTELSLSSSLNLKYLQTLLPNLNPASAERRPIDQAIDKNAAAKRLKALGYSYIGVTSGFPFVRFDSAALSLGENEGSKLLWTSLLSLTPISPESLPGESAFVVRRRHIHTALQNLAELARPSGAPKFVVAHILAPHPPFVFGPNGEERRPRATFTYADGNHFRTQSGTAEDYKIGYTGQITYLNKLVLKTLDDMLAVAKKDTIIVLQGDHGSKLNLNQDDLKMTDLNEVLPILMAIRAPFANRLPKAMSPVNVFRFIFANAFGDDLATLPRHSYYSTWEHPFDFQEVTPR
ncbi:MAG: sulfatase-like hydrolase/transferase [Fimbriimonas sp.]